MDIWMSRCMDGWMSRYIDGEMSRCMDGCMSRYLDGGRNRSMDGGMSSCMDGGDISNLSRSTFYHLRRLRAVRRFVSMPVFKSMVHAFVYSRIDYCNSLLVGLPKFRLSPLQSILNAAARLIARIPRFSHISTYMTEQLHWLPL